jgi:hypothetical protein
MVRDLTFDGSLPSCRRIVRRLGFRWRRTRDNRKTLTSPNSFSIVASRSYRKERVENTTSQLFRLLRVTKLLRPLPSNGFCTAVYFAVVA